MNTFNLPDLGEGLQEAEIVTWHVGAGDNVVVDQPLVSVETEKAVVEIPAPQSGRIAKLRADTGTIVKIGAALVRLRVRHRGRHRHDRRRAAGGRQAEDQDHRPPGPLRPRHQGDAGRPRLGRPPRRRFGRRLAQRPRRDRYGGRRGAGRGDARGGRGRWSRCAASAGPWPRTWSAAMPRSCRGP